MAAAPKNGTILFRGRSGTPYSYSIYNADVANGFNTWATTAGAGASSVNFITAPEDMQLEDISLSAITTDTLNMVLWLDDAPVRNTLMQNANVLASVQTRSFPRVGIRAGRKVQIQALA